MTCIGASGPLIPEVTDAVNEHDLSVVSVLSGNRNFDGRINPDVRMNYLASPPLVVAYAIAGTMDTDLRHDPLGTDADGAPVYLRDIWPDSREIQDVIDATVEAVMFTTAYAGVFDGDERWQSLDTPTGATFAWDEDSTYLRRPPYLDGMTREAEPRSATSTAPGSWSSSATRSPPTTSLRPAPSRSTRRPASTSPPWVWSGSSSTPTPHVVATTR